MSPDLKSKLASDLEKSGFHSEMKAIKAIKENGWSTFGSGTYFDQDGQITRSIDIHACKTAFDDSFAIDIEYHVFVEVKKTEQPWVVFRGPNLQTNYFEGLQNPFHIDNPILKTSHVLNIFRESSVVSETSWIGYGMHEAFKKPQESGRWYSAAVTACKASYECILRMNPNSLTINNKLEPFSPTTIIITHPVVLLDGPLVCVKLDSDGNPDFEEIPFAPFRFEFGTQKYPSKLYRVDLVSLSSISRFLGIASVRVENLLNEIREAKSAEMDRDS